MIDCPGCKKSIHPYQEFEVGVGVVNKCPACLCVVVPQTPVAQVVQQQSPVAQLVERVPVKHVGVGSIPAGRAIDTNPSNIVSMAKARLKEAKKELRNLKKLEKEIAELERLIAAARPRRGSKKVVTPLRAVRTAH